MKTTKSKKQKEKVVYSIHLTADFEDPKCIEDPKEVRKLLFEAAKAANNTPLRTAIHKFPVQGVTGVILLAESHIAIHSWPEHKYLAVDIFSCGKKTQPYKALEYLKQKFCPKKVKIREIDRGNP